MKSSRIMKIFEQYVRKYDMNNINIKARYFHSLKVMEIAKDLATELHIFMSSSTQLTGDFKNGRGIRDQSFIRSSKAVADKADVGCIMVRISDEEKATISPLIESLGLPMPTHVIDVYKNRRSKYNQVKIWTILDLGTCREKDILITTGDYEEIKDFKL